MPFCLVPIGTLCQALKFSMCIHDGQLVVYTHSWPDALSLSAAAITSVQVAGALVRIEPGLLEGVLVE